MPEIINFHPRKFTASSYADERFDAIPALKITENFCIHPLTRFNETPKPFTAWRGRLAVSHIRSGMVFAVSQMKKTETLALVRRAESEIGMNWAFDTPEDMRALNGRDEQRRAFDIRVTLQKGER